MPFTSAFTPTFEADVAGVSFPPAARGSGRANNPTVAAISRVTPDAAHAIAVANGATANASDGVVGPTIIGTAGVAAGTGSAGGGKTRVVVRAISAQATGRAVGADTWVLGTQRRLNAGTPRVITRFRAVAVVTA